MPTIVWSVHLWISCLWSFQALIVASHLIPIYIYIITMAVWTQSFFPFVSLAGFMSGCSFPISGFQFFLPGFDEGLVLNGVDGCRRQQKKWDMKIKTNGRGLRLGGGEVGEHGKLGMMVVHVALVDNMVTEAHQIISCTINNVREAPSYHTRRYQSCLLWGHILCPHVPHYSSPWLMLCFLPSSPPPISCLRFTLFQNGFPSQNHLIS